MKYIRTKDGIYKFDENNEKDYLNYCSSAVADTIEELCDEFVVRFETGYLITYYNKTLLTQDAIKNGADVFGAIWTNKGLTYVAKVNEQGEFELL